MDVDMWRKNLLCLGIETFDDRGSTTQKESNVKKKNTSLTIKVPKSIVT